jgi:hypothetical protein
VVGWYWAFPRQHDVDEHTLLFATADPPSKPTAWGSDSVGVTVSVFVGSRLLDDAMDGHYVGLTGVDSQVSKNRHQSLAEGVEVLL